ncbi:diguanylate cyclase [Herbaspirillum frisingense GSF30]|uniref:diguanylate cyclase n=1 Tax=Herbaspirillum frisingense GSF30 TaxID=864073 RepID=A0AAI9IDM6_9BURK|nr:GGDEF domain-containing protein [Herbaspirillum frisingense]EOA04069.1 diguanylate cyclase [Herbaspirillum frisingense GSF30]
MALDPSTLLILTIALAAAAALYLAVEWGVVRERSLLLWSSGFAIIALGSFLALLRSRGYLLIGIWFANGMLIAAHACFLAGVAWFTRTRLSHRWWLLTLLWLVMLCLPAQPWWSRVMLGVQSLMIAAVTLRASHLLRPHGASLSVGAVQLRYVLLAHGLFYVAKAIVAIVPGTLLDLAAFGGAVIRISLIEGAMAIMLIALSMTGTERYRREQHIGQLAARDPLTGLLNRRALKTSAPALLAQANVQHPGAVLLIDIDNFKQVNDLHGHAAGDQLLEALSMLLHEVLPEAALAARLGGDEFVILLQDARTDQVTRLGESLRQGFAHVAGKSFPTPDPVSLSVGGSVFETPPADLESLLAHTDVALYDAKRAGRDRVVVGLVGTPEV